MLGLQRVVVLVLATACSTTPEPGVASPLDCAWLAGDNCWKTTLAVAESCAPTTGTVGTLSADQTTCTYTDGHVVTSSTSLLATGSSRDVTLTYNGQTCIQYAPEMITTAAGTIALSGDSTSFTLTCPDGSAYTTTISALLACRTDAGDTNLPVIATASAGVAEESFSIDGTDVGELEIYDCKTP